jgi:hypothetical protein
MSSMADTPTAGTKDPRAQAAIRRWEELRSDRVVHEQYWEDIARLIRPQRGGFGVDMTTERSPEKPLSSAPILAAQGFAAGIYANITNPAMNWFGFAVADPDLNSWQPMAEWRDIVTRRVSASFAPSVSSFYPSTYQTYADLACFGNGAGYDEVEPGTRRFVDVALSLAEVVYAIDGFGRVMEVVRRFRLTPRAAVLMFKGDALPAKVYELADRHSTDRHAYYQHVFRNDAFQKGRIGAAGKRWTSLYACEVEEALVRLRGYDDMPFYAPRWDVDSGQVWGTGPGFVALASARTANQMHAATIRAAQQAADPTRLAPDRDTWALSGRIRPGAVVYGGVNANGQPLIRNLEGPGNIGLTIEEKRQMTEDIKEAFQYTLMSLNGRTGLTREETLIMEEARLRNWAPHADRIMEEYAARKVERRFQLLWKAGQLPPPPPEAAGQPLRITYQSAAAMAMRAREGMAIRQFLADVAPMAQVDPRYMDRVSPDDLMEALHDATPSLPARILRSRDEADALAEQRAQMQQAQMAMQAAQAGGSAMRDMAQAEATLAGAQGGAA